MPVELIPLAVPLEQQSDKTGLTLYNKTQQDGYFERGLGPSGEETLMWVKRDGLSLFSALGEPTGVDGLHYWTRQSKSLATCNGKTFRVSSDATTVDATGTATMTAGTRPTYTDFAGTNIYQASGGRIGEFPASSTGAYIADADAPLAVTHLGTTSRFLMALKASSDQFDWSEVNAPTSWVLDFATAESQPDLARGLHVVEDRVHIPGDSSYEFWYFNGDTFIRETAIQRGIIAPYSFANVNGAPIWLDDNAEVVRMQGRVPVSLSGPIARSLQKYGTVSDAIGDYVKTLSGKNLYILSLPVEGKTLVYDIDLNQWYEWGYYNPYTAEYEAFLGRSFANAKGWRKVLVGDRRTGNVYTMSPDHTTDNGDIIRTELRTDFINRGDSSRTKTCQRLVFKFKRTNTATDPNQIIVRFRDDGSTVWENPVALNMEAQSTTDLIATAWQLGSYKERQWKFVISDPTVAALCWVQEEYTVGY